MEWASFTIPTKDYRNGFEAALDDKSPRLRATAACSCSKFPNAQFDAVPDLIKRLDDDNLKCVQTAAISLGLLGTDHTIASLTAKLEYSVWIKSDVASRSSASPKAIEPLRSSLENRSWAAYHPNVKKAIERLQKD